MLNQRAQYVVAMQKTYLVADFGNFSWNIAATYLVADFGNFGNAI
jgi:hypothetical protein